jgi:proteasome lid subunit RPN8/RPN11
MKLGRAVLDEIYEHAQREYPYECCGIVTGDGSGQFVHKCVNIQNRLHSEEPEKYPRDGRTAYTIDRAEADRICSEAEKRGQRIMAFYHSHIDCDAFFSHIDREAQTVLGDPEFPDALHLVVSVTGGRVRGYKCYTWDRDKREFVTVRIS